MRSISARAAFGGVAAVALSTGLPAAQADELADLKTNQQILQRQLDRLQQEQAALGAAPVAPGTPLLAGSFPRSFLIPGTDTSIAIGGYIKFDAAEWLTAGGPNVDNGILASSTGGSVTATLPLKLPNPPGIAAPAFNASARGHDVLHMSAAESRLRIETRTPTAWGEAGTVLEFDFYGCIAGGIDCSNLNNGTNGNLPRLRLAYGTLGGFLAGQAWIPVRDLRSHPTIFDLGGDAGEFGYDRAPWLGYTWQLPYGMSFLAAAVQPTTSFWSPAGGLEGDSAGTGIAGSNNPPTGLAVNPAKSTLPDGNFVLRLERPWGEIAGEAVVQKLEFQDGAFLTRNYVGYGGGVSGHFIPGWLGWKKDNFGFDFYAGDGLGHYANAPGASEPTTANALATNFGGAAAGFYGTGQPGTTTRANAAKVIATTVTQWGAEGNYQHWWAPHWRSTISAGIQHEDVPTTLVGLSAATTGINKQLITAHANIIWSPVAFIDTGFEYVYGHRQTIWRQSASENVVDFSFKVKF